MIGWQSIETAPKDGSDVLLFWPDKKQPIQLGWYVDSVHLSHGKETSRQQRWVHHGEIFDYGKSQPTHWAPLPNGPCVAAAPTETKTDAAD